MYPSIQELLTSVNSFVSHIQFYLEFPSHLITFLMVHPQVANEDITSASWIKQGTLCQTV